MPMERGSTADASRLVRDKPRIPMEHVKRLVNGGKQCQLVVAHT